MCIDWLGCRKADRVLHQDGTQSKRQVALPVWSPDGNQIAFISSNFWDVTGATAFGFRTFWINRTDAHPDELGFRPAGILKGLDELAEGLLGR